MVLINKSVYISIGDLENQFYHVVAHKALNNKSDLVDFDGKGKYRSPEFTWYRTVGPTALKFLSTVKLGKKYQNEMLVADVNNGRIYHFKLDKHKTGLVLNG